MLSFVSQYSDASVIVGLKLQPELTAIVTAGGEITVPATRRSDTGEWLDPETIQHIYSIAKELCPDYPVYRHTSCALAKIMSCPNHTGTVYRADICPPSQCPVSQRSICNSGRRVPDELEVKRALARIGRNVRYAMDNDELRISDRLSQEEYAYIVQTLGFPVVAESVEMQNLYYGSINEGRWTPPRANVD
jgi:hypothetical protein